VCATLRTTLTRIAPLPHHHPRPASPPTTVINIRGIGNLCLFDRHRAEAFAGGGRRPFPAVVSGRRLHGALVDVSPGGGAARSARNTLFGKFRFR